ncbi:uncharacterized protein LDX57_006062 [Aspergillus melleus]|uniref:uncharacterized protein n=1 Tax=Aspergillus melleus TaxID=138277 RepID=UPI001E8ED23C|nr:uncharacterized protein LDX57_006062 [Aspergillus melleus]KAH8428361.1 hypothetical protein LDX57_006062 [Aspergillus melleus]
MSVTPNYFPKGSRILVTGANGYVASNVIQHLVEAGYKVRGTVRTPKPWLDEMFKENFGEDSFESVVLPNFDDVDSLFCAMADVSGVAHVASDVSFGTNLKDVIPWVVRAVQNFLEAASRQPSVQRVVMTSSGVTARAPKPNKDYVTVYEDTWNDEAIKAALDPTTPERAKGLLGYCASKTEAEKAAWQWIKENNPRFTFNAILPCYTIGRVLHEKINGSTMGWVRDLLTGDRQIFSLYVPLDVIDIARLHALALLNPNIVSQRIFGFGSPLNLTDIVSILRKLRPENKQIPNAPEIDWNEESIILPAKKAEKLLQDFCGRKGWTTAEDSIAEGIRGY